MTWDSAEDRAVILDASGSALITLNPVGTLLWAELDEARSSGALVDRLCAEFPDEDRDRLTEDVEAFVASLLAEGLLVAVDPQP